MARVVTKSAVGPYDAVAALPARNPWRFWLSCLAVLLVSLALWAGIFAAIGALIS